MTRPFGFRDKLGYLLGDIGNDFTFVLSSTFLLKFYTDVMGVSAAVVGGIIMIARFIDAFTDVAMGRICDKSPNTKYGKFKPWIRPVRTGRGFHDSMHVAMHQLAVPPIVTRVWPRT